MSNSKSTLVFCILLISQFCGTSLWFAGNALLPQLILSVHWPDGSLGYLTSSVQLGFILGTLLVAITGVTDRFSPSIIFFLCSGLAAIGNLLCLINLESFALVLFSRCCTGFFLAGVYPVGMKIAADWREKGLGFWLGALVGALVLGTSFPHLLRLLPDFISPYGLTISVSSLAVLGGILVLLFIKNGPFRKQAFKFSIPEAGQVFRIPEFRSAAFGYFGHMWELYAFWAFVPWILKTYNQTSDGGVHVTMWSFLVIAAGALGCFVGGEIAQKLTSKAVAIFALVCSAICCLLSPLLFYLPAPLFLSAMVFWGCMVVADSPQFSALVAFHAPPSIRGSAITLVTCIGFAITIFSIQLLDYLEGTIPNKYLLWLLSLGPIIGILALVKKNGKHRNYGIKR